MKYFCLISLAFLIQNCASITRGTNQAFTVSTQPSGAEIRFSNGFACTSPCTINIARRPGFSVTASKEGYRTVTTAVTSGISGAGGTAGAGNILLGGVIGIGVDAYTGAWNELSPNPLFITLEEE
jgi:hypothetical protein